MSVYVKGRWMGWFWKEPIKLGGTRGLILWDGGGGCRRPTKQ